MGRAQTISEYAVWLAVMVDAPVDRRVGVSGEPAADELTGDARDTRPDLIPHPAHRMLHRAPRLSR